MALPGVSKATKKNGEIYYRSSITYKGKHISLGSYSTEAAAGSAYQDAVTLLGSNTTFSEVVFSQYSLPYDKLICILNYRDNGIYIKNPIYLYHKYFHYYLNESTPLKFDIDDLFFYSTHKIEQRGGYLFVADYGMQINILSRYGIKNYGVLGRDYRHVNNNEYDYTYENIEVINPYYGVSRITKNKKPLYKCQLHLNGNYIVGYYQTAEEAAIAYNKAIDFVKQKGCNRSFQSNYILSYTSQQYAAIYDKISLSNQILNWENKTAL